MSNQVEVKGLVKKILFQKDGYYITKVTLKNKDITVTTNSLELKEGLTYIFTGFWIKHPKFGEQFKSLKYEETTPDTKDGVKAYLSSKFFTGVGAKTSERIVNHFGHETVLETLKEDIDKISEVPGLSKKIINSIKDGWKRNKNINEILVFLSTYSINNKLAFKIYDKYQEKCLDILKQQPYRLITEIEGVAFRTADKIAIANGVKKDSFQRLESAIQYVLSQSERDGHCYLLEEQLLNNVEELVLIDDVLKIKNIIADIESSNSIKSVIFDSSPTEKRYYSNEVFLREKTTTEKIHKLLNYTHKITESKLEIWVKNKK